MYAVFSFFCTRGALSFLIYKIAGMSQRNEFVLNSL